MEQNLPLDEPSIVLGRIKGLLLTLQSALYSRNLVNRACGILMERRDLNHDDALQLLIRQARDSGTPLRQVSADLIAGAPADRD